MYSKPLVDSYKSSILSEKKIGKEKDDAMKKVCIKVGKQVTGNILDISLWLSF